MSLGHTHDEEKSLYWSRIEKQEPIPPEVWKFLEDARSGRFLEEYCSKMMGGIDREKDTDREKILEWKRKKLQDDGGIDRENDTHDILPGKK